MDQAELGGRFDGKDCIFNVTENELQVTLGSNIQTFALDSIVAITRGKDREDCLHLFQPREAGDSSPKNLLYERHHTQNLPSGLRQRFQIDKPLEALRLSSSRLWVCVSTLSGTGQAFAFFTHALQPLLSALEINNYRVLETTSTKSISDFAKDEVLQNANSGIDQTIILLSGDGGPVDLINVLADGLDVTKGTMPTIGLIPLGTGNALAHSTGLTNDSTVGTRSLLRGHPRAVPTFQATLSPGAAYVVNEGRSRERISSRPGLPLVVHGAVVCSWGFHASLVADSDTVEYRKFGAKRFEMAAKELLHPSDGSGPHAYRGKVKVLAGDAGDHGSWKDVGGSEHAYTLLTLTSNLEQAFRISPASRPLDGHLRLIHFGPISPEEVMRLMALAYQGGKHVDDPVVHYEGIEGLKILFDEEEERWRRVCLDGKIIAFEKEGWMEVKKSQPVFKLLTPL